MIRADLGDTVAVRYTGRLADGTVFDASSQPLRFILGKKEVISGFETAIAGMYMGESKTFTVPPEQAYGALDEKLVETVDRAILPPGLDPQVGKQLQITGQSGNRLLVLVTAVDEQTVTLNGNHPLAGKELTFEVELLEVKKDLKVGPGEASIFPPLP
ncbi:MAG: peptidylprolyl isomerase [Desulfuromonadales bacterium]|jgi:peptidylprolyl isomerase